MNLFEYYMIAQIIKKMLLPKLQLFQWNLER